MERVFRSSGHRSPEATRKPNWRTGYGSNCSRSVKYRIFISIGKASHVGSGVGDVGTDFFLSRFLSEEGARSLPPNSRGSIKYGWFNPGICVRRDIVSVNGVKKEDECGAPLLPPAKLPSFCPLIGDCFPPRSLIPLWSAFRR